MPLLFCNRLSSPSSKISNSRGMQSQNQIGDLFVQVDYCWWISENLSNLLHMLLNLCVQVCGTYDIDREGSDALLQSCVCKAGPLYTGIALWRNFSGWICSVLFSHILFVTRTIISMPRVHRPIFCLLHAQCPWSHVASHSSQANHQDGFL